MPIEVEREAFLQRLDEVAPGLSPKDIVEQSGCAVFRDGYIWTFNEEVACRTPSGLPKDFKSAVQAEPLRKILRKLPDDTIRINPKKSRFQVEGKKKELWVRSEADILLPIHLIEKPDKWRDVSKDLTDAIGIVQDCASDVVGKVSACVHIMPEYIEAGDGFQICRYRLKTGVPDSILVKADSIRNVGLFDIEKTAETEKWIHFKSATGLILSCLRYVGEYENLEDHLKGTGTKAVLPQALHEAAERAEVFSSEVKDRNKLLVELRPNQMRVTGIGASGGYRERKNIKYGGKPMKFMVTPKLLMKLIEHSKECEIDRKKKHIRVNGGRFVWMACLQDVEKNNGSSQ